LRRIIFEKILSGRSAFRRIFSKNIWGDSSTRMKSGFPKKNSNEYTMK